MCIRIPYLCGKKKISKRTRQPGGKGKTSLPSFRRNNSKHRRRRGQSTWGAARRIYPSNICKGPCDPRSRGKKAISSQLHLHATAPSPIFVVVVPGPAAGRRRPTTTPGSVQSAGGRFCEILPRPTAFPRAPAAWASYRIVSREKLEEAAKEVDADCAAPNGSTTPLALFKLSRGKQKSHMHAWVSYKILLVLLLFSFL